MSASVADRIIAMIAAQALRDPAEISRGATLEEVGLDSLGMVEVVFAIEESFDISVPFNPNEPEKAEAAGLDMLSVQGLIDGVEALIAAKSA